MIALPIKDPPQSLIDQQQKKQKKKRKRKDWVYKHEYDSMNERMQEKLDDVRSQRNLYARILMVIIIGELIYQICLK
jgi:hypothetical protein